MAIQRIMTSVRGWDILDGAVTAAKIAGSAVTTAKLSTGLSLKESKTTAAAMSGGAVVSLAATGNAQLAATNVSARMPAVGVTEAGAASGATLTYVVEGPAHADTLNFSGYVGRAAYVTNSGRIGVSRGATSGQFQQIGVIADGSGLIVKIGGLDQ